MGSTQSHHGDVASLALSVLQYVDWKERGLVYLISRYWNLFMKQEMVYRWFCTRLLEENGVYRSMKLRHGDYSWKKVFFELFQLRDIWNGGSHIPCIEADLSFVRPPSHSARFKISVFTRFRPQDSQQAMDEGYKVTLPLHQRLGLIKLSHGLKSRKEALKILKEEGGWFGKKWSDIEASKENVSQNKVGSKPPPSDMLKASVQNIDVENGRVVMVAPDVGLREFSFDAIFAPASTQKHVYETTAQSLVGDVVNGFNATVIMYGQTGSGKTYTMFGVDSAPTTARQNNGEFFCREQEGIVPRACKELIQAIEQRRNYGIETDVTVSYVEIYGDTITDLLRYGERCGHSRVAAQQFVLSGAAEVPISTLDDVMGLLKQGDAQKRRAATAMNDRSSRAHSLFIVSLKQRKRNSDVTMFSRLFLADLGGSEQVKKSQVDAGSSKRTAVSQPGQEQEFSTGFELGERMRETVYINLGLLALKKCIEALNNDSPYVPFKDSKLTMLLSAGLGGDSKTSVIVCGNMDPRHATETVAALRFGERCSLIEMEIRNNATVLAALLEKIDREIAEMEAAIVRKERWEVVTEERVDELAEEGTLEAALGGKERKLITVLRGAEVERQRLVDLLKQREILTGSDIREVESRHAVNVLGFGKSMAKVYGFGEDYRPELEEKTNIERFEAVAAEESLPAVIKSKGAKQWKVEENVDERTLERRAKKANRNKAVYSALAL